MSSNKPLTVFSLAFALVLVAAGLSYTAPTFALGGSFKTLGLAGENSNLLISCDPSALAYSQWNPHPEDTPPHLDVTATVLCTGYQVNDTSSAFTDCTAAGAPGNCDNQGYFELQVIYNLPDCTYSDSNKGHGNEVCSSVDPQNTGNGGTNIKGSILSGLRCENDPSIPNQSIVTWDLYCEEGVDPNFSVAMDDSVGSFDDANSSYLLWVPGPSHPNPPTWTNCPPGGTFTGDQLACRVRIGGFPTKSKGGTVLTNSTECAKIFPAQGILASQQVLTYKETRNKSCTVDNKPDLTAAPTPVQGSMRFCDSAFGPMPVGGTPLSDAQRPTEDGFDDVYRRCAQVQ